MDIIIDMKLTQDERFIVLTGLILGILTALWHSNQELNDGINY